MANEKTIIASEIALSKGVLQDKNHLLIDHSLKVLWGNNKIVSESIRLVVQLRL